MFSISLTTVLLFFAALAVAFGASCLGAYYLFSNQYSSFSLLLSALIFFAPVVFSTVRYTLEGGLMMLGFLGMPFSFLGAIFEDARYFFVMIGVLINYLAVFGVINLIGHLIKNTI